MFVYMYHLHRLLITLITQFETPLGMNAVCRSNHSLFAMHMTDLQTALCNLYPDLVSLLATDVIKVIEQQCYNQFKYEKWNCKNITVPIFGATHPFLTLRKLNTIRN